MHAHSQSPICPNLQSSDVLAHTALYHHACPGPVWIDTARQVLVEVFGFLQQVAVVTLCKLSFLSLGCIRLDILPAGNTTGSSGGCDAIDPTVETVWAPQMHECGECFSAEHINFLVLFFFITLPYLVVSLRCSVVVGNTSWLDMVPPGSNVIKHHFLRSWRYLGIKSAGPFTRHAPTAWKYNMCTHLGKLSIILITSIGGRWGGAAKGIHLLLIFIWACGLLGGSIFFRPFAGVPLCRFMVVARSIIAWTVVYLAVQVNLGAIPLAVAPPRAHPALLSTFFETGET